MDERHKNKSVLIVGLFIVLAVILVVVTIAAVRWDSKESQAQRLSEEERLWLEAQAEREDPFVSTPEQPYDTSLDEMLEESKEPIDRNLYKLTRQTIRPMIAQARWDEAYDYLFSLFEDFRFSGEYGESLYRYYEDLGIMVDFGDVDPTRYERLFQTFKAPETFLAAMIYYPFSVNHTGYLNPKSLAPNTETTNIRFEEMLPDRSGEAMEWLERFRPGRYQEAWVQPFTIEDMNFEAWYALDVEGHWHMMEIRSEDEKAWWIMTVEEWRDALNV